MITIPLAAVPNQTLSVQIGQVRWGLTLKDARGVMVADVERAGVVLLQAVRVVAHEPVIPYGYLEDGNFLLTTLNDDLPGWSKFGDSQELVYMTQTELDAIRG